MYVNVCNNSNNVTYVIVCNACNACNACNTCVVRVKWCNVCNECKCMKCSNSPAASSSSYGNCRLLRPRTVTLKSGLARDVTATLSRSARSNPPRHIGEACRWLRCASKPLFVSKAIPHPLHVDLNTSVGAIGLGSTFFWGLGRPPGCRSDGTGRDICPPKLPAMLKICRRFVARLND